MFPNGSHDHLGSDVPGYLDSRSRIIYHDNVRSEPVHRSGRRSGEPSLLSMIKASPEEFQRLCEDGDRARSTEFVQHVAADRRSMLGEYTRERSTYGGIGAGTGGGAAGVSFESFKKKLTGVRW